jgi:putative transcriptional regulator
MNNMRTVSPSPRELRIDPDTIRQIRTATRLSQKNFASVINIELATLRNWEQGRRAPTGPAKALLRAIQMDPVHVLRALSG